MEKVLSFEEKQELRKAKILSCYNTDSLEKGGEGSRGGKIIGHTKSGKPVYEDKSGHHSIYKDFTPQDHEDAIELHSKKNHEYHSSWYKIRKTEIPNFGTGDTTDKRPKASVEEWSKWYNENPERAKEFRKLGDKMSNHANKVTSHENAIKRSQKNMKSHDDNDRTIDSED